MAVPYGVWVAHCKIVSDTIHLPDIVDLHFYHNFPADSSSVPCSNIRIAQFSDRWLREGARVFNASNGPMSSQ